MFYYDSSFLSIQMFTCEAYQNSPPDLSRYSRKQPQMPNKLTLKLALKHFQISMKLVYWLFWLDEDPSWWLSPQRWWMTKYSLPWAQREGKTTGLSAEDHSHWPAIFGLQVKSHFRTFTGLATNKPHWEKKQAPWKNPGKPQGTNLAMTLLPTTNDSV